MKVLLLRTLWTITFLTGADMAEPFVNTNVSSPSSGTSSPMSLSIGVRQVPGKVLEFYTRPKEMFTSKKDVKTGGMTTTEHKMFSSMNSTEDSVGHIYSIYSIDFPCVLKPKEVMSTSHQREFSLLQIGIPSTWYSHEYADVGALMRRIEVCEEIQAFGRVVMYNAPGLTALRLSLQACYKNKVFFEALRAP